MSEKELLKEVVRAWEALEGGRKVLPSTIECWLADDMAPAINKIRKYLKGTTNDK